ncbi:MAG: putative selenate reductase subunit YgfK [Chloroflexi bacterium]|nr:putative selenate reductase subunit YgfK [Chloroflexota bacterium]
MSDEMRVQPFDLLLRRILTEYEHSQSIFGIHKSLFYTPRKDAPYATPDFFGHVLATPIGPSAGPHTQLSQNIISAWLCGGRFIELKTVQIMDELEIPRPCIDMEDEGYNVEWSQELKLEQSAQEYVNAWAAIHVLRRLLGWEDAPLGTIFDMSVGYNLEGIKTPRMTRFMNQMADATAELAEIQATLKAHFPQFSDLPIPARLTNSVTLSTMHGCPPDEIERIGRYLLEERHLHTVVKMNPTLLGKERVLGILHDDLGFTEIHIPGSVFEKDLKYETAVGLIRSLQGVAAERKLTFGVKLSNTLAMHNHKPTLPGEEMYMSGRALYPVTMNLFDKLAHEFDGNLRVSYSAGADAVNIATILACGARPVTACSDLLKPGGYARLGQWLESIEAAMGAAGAADLDEFAQDKLAAVEHAAAEALTNPCYNKHQARFGLPKVKSGLGLWDCVVAPCIEACAVEQDVPEYAWLIAQGDYDRALEVILARNPLPGVTGYVCTHLCQTRCTRNDYEESVAIRALKRIAEERGNQRISESANHESRITGHESAIRYSLFANRRVAIIGSGPSGLAAAAFLAVSGVQATIFEAKDVVGGMMRAVPPFRLPGEIIQRDVDRITALGVEIRLNTPVKTPPEELLRSPASAGKQGFDAVYIASGFQRDTPLRVPGVEGPGVMPALRLLDRSRRGERVDLGHKAVVIGGGDTAMDATRTAQRFTGNPVTILYRRTRHEMPAAEEELEGALEEGNLLEELVAPVRIIRENVGQIGNLPYTPGKVVGIECVRNRLGEPGPDGRREPVVIAGSEFIIPCDAVIVAVGQLPELTFLDGSGVARHKGGGVVVDPETGCAGPKGVYAGGDVVIKPDSIIAACADGRRAAEAICAEFCIPFQQPASRPAILSEADILAVKQVRARKVAQVKPAVAPISLRGDFRLIEETFTEEEARIEALRCVQCTTFCDKCVEVCPNRANLTFLMQPVAWTLPQLACQNGGLAVVGSEPFEVIQNRQILHVDDWCNECDDCQTFCVHHGLPYRDKPRLFLDETVFQEEQDNAFRIEGNVIRRREGGREARLVLANGSLVYEDVRVRLTLTPEWQIQEMALKEAFKGTLSLRDAAEMAVVYQGVRDSLPALLI